MSLRGPGIIAERSAATKSKPESASARPLCPSRLAARGVGGASPFPSRGSCRAAREATVGWPSREVQQPGGTRPRNFFGRRALTHRCDRYPSSTSARGGCAGRSRISRSRIAFRIVNSVSPLALDMGEVYALRYAKPARRG